MDFTVTDQQSTTWLKLKAHLKERELTLLSSARSHAPADIRAETVGRLGEIEMILGFEKDYLERVEQTRVGGE